jgi:hypothetical protein
LASAASRRAAVTIQRQSQPSRHGSSSQFEPNPEA